MATEHQSAQSPLVNDFYQFTMAYAYWKDGRHEEEAVFDLFFRKNPFGGTYAVFAGLADFLDFVENFRFTDEEVDYLAQGPMAGCEEGFFEWLRTVDASDVTIHAFKEGSVVFPREPLIRVEGPLAVAQLLETPALYCVNFPSLVTTNAARHRVAAGFDKTLLEFGLRRAQDGMRASHYTWLGGFDGSSNVEAMRRVGENAKGTMAHSFVTSYGDMSDLLLDTMFMKDVDGIERSFAEAVLAWRQRLAFENTHEGELAAFISYAAAYPDSFIALVDTYDTMKSGVPNFICVALALLDFGHTPVGLRLDSGDLADLSVRVRALLRDTAHRVGAPALRETKIFASDDINEAKLLAMNNSGHEIDGFGIGTHQVTCQAQPAFGAVYKLVEVNGEPRIKLSAERNKATLPGKKDVYRIFDRSDIPVVDYVTRFRDGLQLTGADKIHERAATAQEVLLPVWRDARAAQLPARQQVREYVRQELQRFDHVTRVKDPEQYPVRLSEQIAEALERLQQENTSF